MNANPWFRMYSEFANDPKVQSMPEAMQRRLVMLLCLRCSDALKNLCDGDVAFALRLSDVSLSETKDLFVSKGFISDTWSILNWDKRQFVSDSSSERTRLYRERMRTSQERECDALEQNRTEQNREIQTLAPSSRAVQIDTAKPPKSGDTVREWFDREFWPLWPVKSNKEKAKLAAKKISAKERPFVIAGIRSQSERIQGMERPIHASTWLNGRRWEDEAQSISAMGGSPQNELWPGQHRGRPNPGLIG